MAEPVYYDGDVCYADGWHWTAIPHPDGIGNGDDGHVYQVPDEKIVCEDTPDGEHFRYRLATEDDERSWHDRKHGKFCTVELADGGTITLSPGELEEILAKRREEQ